MRSGSTIEFISTILPPETVKPMTATGCPPARRHLGTELRHLPRPLPAHRGRLEVYRARLRGPLPRHQPASGLASERTRGRSGWRGDCRVLTRAGQCVRDEPAGLNRLDELPQERDGRVRPVLRGGDRLADLHEARLDQP